MVLSAVLNVPNDGVASDWPLTYACLPKAVTIFVHRWRVLIGVLRRIIWRVSESWENSLEISWHGTVVRHLAAYTIWVLGVITWSWQLINIISSIISAIQIIWWAWIFIISRKCWHSLYSVLNYWAGQTWRREVIELKVNRPILIIWLECLNPSMISIRTHHLIIHDCDGGRRWVALNSHHKRLGSNSLKFVCALHADPNFELHRRIQVNCKYTRPKQIVFRARIVFKHPVAGVVCIARCVTSCGGAGTCWTCAHGYVGVVGIIGVAQKGGLIILLDGTVCQFTAVQITICYISIWSSKRLVTRCTCCGCYWIEVVVKEHGCIIESSGIRSRFLSIRICTLGIWHRHGSISPEISKIRPSLFRK